MAQINQQIANYLWQSLQVVVENFHPHIQIHPKHRFLGYVRIRVTALPTVLPGLDLTLTGIQVKLLRNGNLSHIDWPSDKGADGEFYPKYMARSPELRAVLTAAIFQNDEIIAAVRQSQVLFEQAQAAASAAPAAGMPQFGAPAGVPTAMVPAPANPAGAPPTAGVMPNPLEAAAAYQAEAGPGVGAVAGMPDFSEEIPGL